MIQLILKILLLTLVPIEQRSSWIQATIITTTIPDRDINKHAVITNGILQTDGYYKDYQLRRNRNYYNYLYHYSRALVNDRENNRDDSSDVERYYCQCNMTLGHDDLCPNNSKVHMQPTTINENYHHKILPPAVDAVDVTKTTEQPSTNIITTAGSVVAAGDGNNRHLSKFRDVRKTQSDDGNDDTNNLDQSQFGNLKYGHFNDGSYRDLWLDSKVHHRNRRSNIRQNLCDIEECVCKTDNNFITVECNFKNHGTRIFNSNNYISNEKPGSIIFNMSAKVHLQFHEGFFHNNNINNILIQSELKREARVEFLTKALYGNLAPCPEIVLINCHTIILNSKSFSDIAGEFSLNITNSKEVDIFENAFLNTSFTGYFINIESLHLWENSLSTYNKTKIEINNCLIETLHKFGAVNDIKFIRTKIHKIASNAFGVPSISSIIFNECDITTIETIAFPEKLYCIYFSITGSKIGTIESNAIEKNGINNFIIHNNNINIIESNAIHSTTFMLIISNNSINLLGPNWLHIDSWQNVSIFNNKFGDFNGPTIGLVKNPIECKFYENYITNANENSLSLNNSHCEIYKIYFTTQCTCNLDWLKRITNADIRAQSYCRLDNMLNKCYNASLFNVGEYESDICDSTKTEIDCKNNQKLKRIEDNFIDSSAYIEQDNQQIKVICIIIGCIILLIAIFVILALIIRKIIKSRTITIPVAEMNTSVTYNGSLKYMKMFSNDDRVIINQTLENMKVKYPPEKYDQAYNHTRKLLDGNLSETEKVLTIGEIVRCLGECESTGEDFVAFTDILYKHLAPKDTNQNDPVYSEPVAPVLISEPDIYNVPDGQTNLDHIYAEPHSVQQPLLKNEYSAPLDRNESQTNFYSEPIVNTLGQRHIITPYAIGNNLDNLQQNTVSDSNNLYEQPSTSRNLPDVLNRSLPKTQPQQSKLPQPSSSSTVTNNAIATTSQFYNDPKYHITRSPITNRHIPKYTVPSAKRTVSRGQTGASHSPDSLSSSTSHSNHSGGSDVTCKIDDVIDYADA